MEWSKLTRESTIVDRTAGNTEGGVIWTWNIRASSLKSGAMHNAYNHLAIAWYAVKGIGNMPTLSADVIDS